MTDINRDLYARLKNATKLLEMTFGEPPLLIPPSIKDTQPTRFEAWAQIRQNRELFENVDSR